MHLILRIHLITEKVGSGGYPSDFNVGGARFECCSGHWLKSFWSISYYSM